MIDTVLVGAGGSQQLPAPDQELGDVTMPSIPHHNSLHPAHGPVLGTPPLRGHSGVRGGMNQALAL